jgi:hypothetical protein
VAKTLANRQEARKFSSFAMMELSGAVTGVGKRLTCTNVAPRSAAAIAGASA